MSTITRSSKRPVTCDPATRVTRSLLGYGVLAGPFYVVVSLAQALTRDGFDLTRHSWSLLSNGSLGWIQITNFVLSGLFTIAAAVGLSRALGGTGLRSSRGSRWAPRLLGVYGVSLIGAGAFRADPAAGFPAGTPADANAVSWHGMLHLAVGAVGFLCLIAACFVLATRFARERSRGWATYSAVTGVIFFGGFVGIASGQGNPATVVTFVVAVLVAWSWVSALSVHFYRRSLTNH
ncbi:DUF998 domain-containing protein [Flindersiella endophytica]